MKREFLRRPWVIAASALGWVLLFGYWAPWAGGLAGRIEGARRPAADLIIQRVETTGASEIEIWGQVNVLRPECSFRGLTAHLGGNGARDAPVTLTIREPARVRPAGLSEFGPWALNIAAAEVSALSMTAAHACPLRPWLVQTVIYP